MEKYYIRKLGPRYEQIEWSILKKALIKKRAKGALLKMLHGVCPTQKHMTKIRLTSHPECPCCSEAEEDIFHILNCRERSHEVVATFTEVIKKKGKAIQDQDNILEQIIDSARNQSNKMDNKWKMETQNEIGWGLLLKGLVTKEWKSVTEVLAPKSNWEDTMSTIITALWQTWLDMWRQRNNSIDFNARYCTQVQDDNNRLSIQMIYSLRNMLGKSINKVMKNSGEDHLKLPRNQVTDWLLMYRQLIEEIITEQDPDLWEMTRETWIARISSEG